MQRLLLLFFPIWLSAQVPLQTAVQASLFKLINDPQLKGTKWSVCAIDLTNGDTIAAYDAAQQLPGASITKLISSAAAFHILGPEHRAQTQLVLEGTMKENGVWNGNLRILGAGDVTLGSRYFNAAGTELYFLNEWVAVLQSKGIKSIQGQIIADGKSFGSFTCPLGWQQEDMGNYYGCGAFGLNFYDNILKLNFQTGANGTPIKLKSTFPIEKNYLLSIQATSANIASDQTFIHGEPFNYQRTIKGKLPANRSNFEVKASMPDPEQLLAEQFCGILQTNGISVANGAFSARKATLHTADATLKSTVIHTHQGKALKEIIYWTNHKSVNLFAEGILLQLGHKRYQSGNYENSLIVLDSVLRHWEIGPCRIVDGSGLSKENRMSASQFVKLLSVQTKMSYFDAYFKSLPIAGVSGTVASLCKNQAGEGKVHAKSGSLSGVKAYAGYVDSKSGHQIAFAIIANDFKVSGAVMAKKMEPFLNSLATYLILPE